MTFDEYAGHAGPDRNAPDYKEQLARRYPPKAEFIPFEKGLYEAFGKQNNKTTMNTELVKTNLYEVLRLGDEMELGGVVWKLEKSDPIDTDYKHYWTLWTSDTETRNYSMIELQELYDAGIKFFQMKRVQLTDSKPQILTR